MGEGKREISSLVVANSKQKKDVSFNRLQGLVKEWD
jgi:hypothetical protein